VLLGAVLVVGGCSGLRPGADASNRRLDVIFVPTDVEVATVMLEAAHVGPDDVVYDLGCGDGRILIMAARRFGARGVGVDLDPQRIREARQNAIRAQVSDRVTFFVQDLLVADVSGATVVALYLSRELNLHVRAKLLRELKPGSRVVSHDYDMDDWPPDRVIEIERPHLIRPHRVYLWRIPEGAPGR
jgi:SAM-dependent methyltransferase